MFQSLPGPAKALIRRFYFMLFRGSPAPDRLLYAIDEPRGQRPLRAIRGRCVLRGWAVLKDRVDPPRVRIKVNRALYPVRVMARADVREAFHRSPPYAEACGFELALQLNRGAHLIRVEVELHPGVWRPLSTTLFLSLGLRQPLPQRVDYAAWTDLAAAWRPLERREFEAHLPLMTARPRFEVFVEAARGGDSEATRASLAAQIYPDLEIHDLAEGETPPPARDGTGYRMFLRAGDRLAEDALYAFADRINADPALEVLHGDEDLVDADGVEREPFFKPDWSPTYLAAANYLGRAAVFSNRVGYAGPADRLRLVRAVGPDGARVASIPRVLLHRPADDAEGLLADAGRVATETSPPPAAGVAQPRVLLVVRGRGSGRPPPPTDYPLVEIVREVRPSAKTVAPAPPAPWLDGLADRHDVLVFVDEDLTDASPAWIEALVAPLADGAVAAVGPVLVDRATGMRHVGLTNDDGEPAPIRVETAGVAPLVPRNVLGVSRACLATRVDDFIAVGGFVDGLGPDLEGLDYCLKLARRGRLIAHTPGAELSMARWRAPRPEAVTWHQQTWPESCARDPYYREDALTTRPATHRVAMKLSNP